MTDPVQNVAQNTATDIDKKMDTNVEIVSKTKIEEPNYEEFAKLQFVNDSETKIETMTKNKIEEKKLGENIEPISEELIEIDESLEELSNVNPGNIVELKDVTLIPINQATLSKNKPINTNCIIKNSMTVACQRCDETFSSVKDLKIHIDTLHLQG